MPYTDVICKYKCLIDVICKYKCLIDAICKYKCLIQVLYVNTSAQFESSIFFFSFSFLFLQAITYGVSISVVVVILALSVLVYWPSRKAGKRSRKTTMASPSAVLIQNMGGDDEDNASVNGPAASFLRRDHIYTPLHSQTPDEDESPSASPRTQPSHLGDTAHRLRRAADLTTLLESPS